MGQRYLGVMLPYTPLHILLLREAGRPLVMTSGNLAEEPMVKDWEETERLAGIADAYLVHDRAIAARCDDSVAQVHRGRPRLVRRARGYAPFPLPLPRSLPQVLACGAELKNTFCLTRDTNAFLSPHIGDLENLETLESFEEGIGDYRRLFDVDPEVVAHDLHPEYLGTKYALALPGEKVAVQHHHAHVAAAMVEAGHEEAVIGVSLDGLGYGDDGVLWGGEVLVCDLTGYRRVAHLEELPLPGGALAIRRPWRTALGWSLAALGPDGLERAARLLQSSARGSEEPPDAEAVETLVRQVETGTNAPLTTSCGRLFDAVAALAGVRLAISYEGQAAIELEMRSRPGEAPYPYALDGDPGAAAEASLLPAAAHVVEAGRGAGVPPAVVRVAPLLAGVLDDVEAGRARRPGRRPPARHADGPRGGCLSPGARHDGPRGRGARRRSLPEPSAGRALRRRPAGGRLPPDRRKPRPGQRRRHRTGAGRGGGLYCAPSSQRALTSHSDRTPPMCLAIPMCILSIDGDLATIAVEGLEQRASLMLVPDAGVGDWVLVHAGYAINVLPEDEAYETLELIAQLEASDEPGREDGHEG